MSKSKTTRGLLAAALAVTILGSAGPVANAQRDSSEPGARGRDRALPPVTAVGRDALHRAFARGRLSEAQYALERARSLFRLGKVRRDYGEVTRPDPHAATLLLRDLALRAGELSGDDARRAQAILARPDDADDPDFESFGLPPYSGPKETSCSPSRGYCLHWAPSDDSTHAPDQTDTTPANGIPDFVDVALTTMDKVWDDYDVLGFREPKKDGTSSNKGPDNKTDIYLADVGDAGIYGYCTTDDPNAFNLGSGPGQYPYFDFSAYCVLDNDYVEFPTGTPISNLQVTAAHEFFHAVQFAYDAAEDGWILEGTATSMEDVVYDDINDNLQFLLSSQFVNPAIPLDFSNPNFGHPNFNLRYGTFAFWRFMTEFLAPGPAQDDTVIQKVWSRVDASAAAQFNDEWSLKAAKNVAKKNYGVGFKKLFSFWGAALLFPEAFMEEGASYRSFLQTNAGWTGAPISKSATLTPGDPASPWYSTRLDHLTGRYYRFLPGSGVDAGDMLKVKVNGPKRFKGTNAVLVMVNGTEVTVERIGLNKKGDGSVKVPFPDAAYLIQQNASTRVRACYSQPAFTSCMGIPRDDDLRFLGKGKLIEG